jgi:glycosyltransferase EpsF
METWLMNLVRERSPEVKFDFLVGGMWGGYEEEAQRLGSRFHFEEPASRFLKRLRIAGLAPRSRFLERVLSRERYDVFHVHGEEFMGDAVRIAARAGVPVRIVHCHGTALARGQRSPEMALRSLRFRTLDRQRIRRYATDIVACSNEAGRFLVDTSWDRDSKCRPLYCGVPLGAFREVVERLSRPEVRKAHGIPSNAIVVGHAGSMGPTPTKNHLGLIKIFAVLAARDERYFLFLAGDGPLRASLAEEIRVLGLTHRVLMPGIVSDVPALMVHAFDVHALPSFREGLPVVGLEAVAAGLFTVCSRSITREFTEAFPGRIRAIHLEESPERWADAIEDGVRRRVPPSEGVALVEKSPFSIASSLRETVALYANRLRQEGRRGGATEVV